MSKTVKKFNTIPKTLSRKKIKEENKISKLLNKVDIEKLVLIMEEI